jgi:hypothetical protein
MIQDEVAVPFRSYIVALLKKGYDMDGIIELLQETKVALCQAKQISKDIDNQLHPLSHRSDHDV